MADLFVVGHLGYNSAMARIPVRRPRVDYRRDLASFVQRPGPFLSVYLDVRPGPQRESARERLLAALEVRTAQAGPPVNPTHWDAAGSALSMVADDDATLVSMIAADGTTLTTGYPDPPRTDLVEVAGLPRLGPLLRAEQSLVHHVVAVFEADTLGIGTVPRHGEPSDVRYEATDRLAVPAMIHHAARAARTGLVLLCGPETELPWLESQVRAGLDPAVTLEAVATDDLDDETLAEELTVRAASHAARKTVELIRLWRFHHSHDEAVDGTDAIRAVLEGRAALILVNDDFDDRRTAYHGSGPSDVSLDGRKRMVEGSPGADDDVEQAISTGEMEPGRLADVIIRAGLVSGSPLHVIPDLSQTLDGGIGVILSDRAEAGTLAALLEQ